MKSRLWIFLALMALWAGAISARLYRVQVVDHARYLDKASEQQQRVVELVPPRGTLFDARGRTLAVSVAVDSVYVLPHEVLDPAGAAAELARLLAASESEIFERLTSEKRWLWLERQLDPPVAGAVRALELEGIGFVRESKRFYPLQETAGAVLGFVGTDHTGLAGLEAAYNELVSGRSVDRRLVKDARDGRVVAPGYSFIDAEPGADLHLTLDATVQHVVEEELAAAVSASSAKQGVAILMNPADGAILAMASEPAFDPNRFSEYDAERWQNLAIQFAYEPGSTFKAVTAAAALDRNLIDPMDVIDCEHGSITLGRTVIRDHKPFGDLTLRDVIAASSNVGAIKTGLLVEREDFFATTRDFGFGQRTNVDLPGESAGILRPVERWARNEAAYLSIGQGLSVTPMQLVTAFAALANGGYRVRPHLVSALGRGGRLERLDRPIATEPVAHPATLRSLLRMLEAVVDEGTGRAAAVDGYRVAGKTGTAQKAVPGEGYSATAHIASFAGFAPSREPVVVGVVILDEPVGRYHGGEVAAPVFGRVVERALPYLAVPPAPGSRLAAAPGERPVLPAREARRELPIDAIPDLQGLTAREAIRVLAKRGITPSINGSGFVSAQSPPAGLPLDAAQGTVEIWLGDRSS